VCILIFVHALVLYIKLLINAQMCILLTHLNIRGRDSVVGVLTRWTVQGSNSVQTGPGAPPASYTKGTGSFPVVKRPVRGVDHPPHLAPRLKEE